MLRTAGRALCCLALCAPAFALHAGCKSAQAVTPAIDAQPADRIEASDTPTASEDVLPALEAGDDGPGTPGDGGAPDDVAATASACTWTTGATNALTSGTPLRLLDALALAADAVWIAYHTADEAAPDRWLPSVLRVGFDGASLGAPAPLPFSHAFDVGGVSIASTARNSAAVGPDDTGACEIVQLGRDAAPALSVSPVTPRRCVDLRTEVGGYSVLFAPMMGAEGPVTYAPLDPNGTSNAGEVAVVDAGDHVAGAVRRAVLPGGDVLLVWATPTQQLAMRTVGANGRPVGARRALDVHIADAGRLRAVATGEGVLLAWPDVIPGSTATGVSVLALDRTGLPLAPPALLAAPRSDRAVNLDLATSRGDVLLVWTEATSRSGAVGVRAQALSPTGRVRSEVVNVGDFGHDTDGPTYPQVIATPDGAMLAYFAQRDPAPAPMELYATPLRCAPR